MKKNNMALSMSWIWQVSAAFIVYTFLVVWGALAISLDLTTQENQDTMYGFGIAAVVLGALGLIFVSFAPGSIRRMAKSMM